MTESNDSIEKAVRHIRDWLRINAENQRAVRPLTDILEVLEWAKETIQGLQARGVSHFGTLFVHYDAMYESLVQFLPSASAVNLSGLDRFTSTASTVLSSGLLSISTPQQNEGMDRWVAERFDRFTVIQDKHQTIEKLRLLIGRLQIRDGHPPDLLSEYDHMIEKAFYFRGSEIDLSISAGIAMRNVLEHYKGKLFLLAHQVESDRISWPLMVARIASADDLSLERGFLLEQEVIWNDLHAQLSDLAKNRREIDTKVLAVQLINHLYGVLRLLGF